MFRLLGDTVELIRYKISYTESEEEITANCISEEHKDEVENNLKKQGISFNTEVIDQTGNEWFNGLKFSSYDEALKAFNRGEKPLTELEQLQKIVADLTIKELKSEGAIV